ncbi:MAG: type II toxin-antitoxin system VapC family toxin, partial [Deltaproteobacteria bacterium]|nr:type II toxin-antitoxin system VapC family toxin [Deltaproteobacteria bacterium]
FSTLFDFYCPQVREEIFGQTENSIIISELAVVELYSSLVRKVRTGEISLQAQEEAVRNFEEDCAQRFVIDPLGSAVLQKVKELLQRYGNTKALRSLDSLQLAAGLVARARGELVFVCADGRLLGVAAAEGVQILNPESS